MYRVAYYLVSQALRKFKQSNLIKRQNSYQKIKYLGLKNTANHKTPKTTQSSLLTKILGSICLSSNWCGDSILPGMYEIANTAKTTPNALAVYFVANKALSLYLLVIFDPINLSPHIS